MSAVQTSSTAGGPFSVLGGTSTSLHQIPTTSSGLCSNGGLTISSGIIHPGNSTTPHSSRFPLASDQLLLSLRQRPHCRVFRALFQYLPLRDSPNENPQLELALAPGDVILVKGEMDSDGFFSGETLDGRVGLVPSNYVERVPDHLILQNARAPSPSFPLSVPPHLAAIPHDFTEFNESETNNFLPDSVCPYPPADVTKVSVQEIKQNDSPRVPCPRDLVVEKKLSRSLVISWSPPEESFVAVSQYHVCIDGHVRAVVPGSYKCRALIEDVALDSSVNVSIRAVTDQGHSPDEACNLSVGTQAPVAPQHLRVWQVTPVSACVRWLPSNSNAEHVVSLNAVKVGVCPPSVYQVQLQGLTPSTIYRISIRTKHPRAVLEQRPVERCLDFKTLPKIGLPDPPTNVQVEHGPQPGHLLISWTPITNQPKPPSRAAVAAYLIYADGKNIAQVPSDTADHVVLRLADLSDDPPIFVTVRTKTREGAVSSDSNVARVPRGPAGQPTSVYDQPPQAQILTTTVLDPMASSFPSYPQPTYQTAYAAPLGGLSAATSVPTAATYANPSLLNQLPFQSNPLNSYSANVLQGYNSYDRCAAAAAQGLQMANNINKTTIPHNNMSSLLATSIHGNSQMGIAPASNIQTVLGPTALSSLPNSHQGTLQASVPKWKTSASQMSQYYTFHPRLLRADGTTEEPRPSVLEMENSYLLRHRQSEWNSSDARTRMDIYARQTGRTGSADDRQLLRHRLIPPRLARVKSENGFGTRSEPDLRPPTLDDDCRMFVALFDYNHHMSPNANAENEELSFRKHQLIKVYGGPDADGFLYGQIGNRFGLVPSNMVIEIAKGDILPPAERGNRVERGSEMIPVEPALRRQRWGSVKSRSYDHAGDRRNYDRPGGSSHYASLGRRELDRRTEGPTRDRYRRSNGRDYEYRRDYDDRYREPSRDRRDEYYRDRDDDDLREKYINSRYDRDYDRRDDRREDRGRQDDRNLREERRGGEYDMRRMDRDYRDDERHRRDRREDGYREDARTTYDAHGQPNPRYDQPPMMNQPQMANNSMNSQYAQSQVMGHNSAHQMNQLNNQMNHMNISNMQQMNGPMGHSGMNQQQSQPPLIPNGMPGAIINDMDLTSMPRRQMVAKFDYDSRQLSPNVDAEQVELSFRQGDIITVFGEMDDDGFYRGELNGCFGLVPSNFLQSSPLTTLAPSQPTEPMMTRKGVAFSDAGIAQANQMMQQQPQAAAIKKPLPSSQTSTTSAATNMSKPVAKKSTAGQPGAKPLAKKTSDVGKGSSGTPNVRKTSTAVKKSDSQNKKK
ncbi:unnamed protein product [Auanema sp. JU1783]|nr:unnamed protein product [Auanema sp. JU1783]